MNTHWCCSSRSRKGPTNSHSLQAQERSSDSTGSISVRVTLLTAMAPWVICRRETSDRRLGVAHEGNDVQHRQGSVIPRCAQRGREETLRRLTDWTLSAFRVSHRSCSVRLSIPAGLAFTSTVYPFDPDTAWFTIHMCNSYQSFYLHPSKSYQMYWTGLLQVKVFG